MTRPSVLCKASEVISKNESPLDVFFLCLWHSIVIAFLTDSDKPSDYWHLIKQREFEEALGELSPLCRQLKLESADGKKHLTEIINADISKATFGLTPSEYKELKKLARENLRKKLKNRAMESKKCTINAEMTR